VGKKELPPAKMVVDKFRIKRDANIMKKLINLGIGRKHIIKSLTPDVKFEYG